MVRSNRSQMLYKIGLLKKIARSSRKQHFWSQFIIRFSQSKTPSQVFSCEFYETSKKTFFTEHLW